MTPKPTLRLLLGALLILAPARPALAESSPEARKWLEKLTSIYDLGSFKVDYEADLDMSGLGQPIAGTLKGKLTQADRTHSRVELTLDLPGAAGAPGTPGAGMSLSLLIVTDGTTVWTETYNSALGGRQVTKVSLADLEAAGDAPGGLGVSPTSMDPVAQLETLSRTMDFEVVEQDGGTVTLRGKVTDATRAEAGMLAAPGVDGFIFVLDRKTGFPTQIRADGETPFVTLHFRDLQLLDAGSLPEGLFEYSPPEGLPVMDLGPRLKSAAEAPAQP